MWFKEDLEYDHLKFRMIEQKNKEIPQGHKLRNTITFFAGLAKVVIYLSIPALILMESPDTRECFSGFKSHQQQRDHRPFISIFQIMQKSYFISRPVERPIESLHHIKVHLRPLDGGCKIVSVWMNTHGIWWWVLFTIENVSHTTFTRGSASGRKPEKWERNVSSARRASEETKRQHVKPSKLHCINQSSILLFRKWALAPSSSLSWTTIEGNGMVATKVYRVPQHMFPL